jgi:hypothetical protein
MMYPGMKVEGSTEKIPERKREIAIISLSLPVENL